MSTILPYSNATIGGLIQKPRNWSLLSEVLQYGFIAECVERAVFHVLSCDIEIDGGIVESISFLKRYAYTYDAKFSKELIYAQVDAEKLVDKLYKKEYASTSKPYTDDHKHFLLSRIAWLAIFRPPLYEAVSECANLIGDDEHLWQERRLACLSGNAVFV